MFTAQTRLRISLSLSIARSVVIGLLWLPLDLLDILRVLFLPPSADVQYDAPPRTKSFAQHNKDVAEIAAQLTSENLRGRKVALGKKVIGAGHTGRSNLYKYDTYQLDVSKLDAVLELNVKDRYAIIEPGVSMSSLASLTLPYGLLFPVIPELRRITVGGAVQGLGVESSSIHQGLCDSHVIDANLLVPNLNGSPGIVTRQQDPEYWSVVVGSCGSLSIITQIKVKLVPATRWMKLRYVKYKHHSDFTKECIQKRKRYIESGNGWVGNDVVADAIVFKDFTIGIFGGCIETEQAESWKGPYHCAHAGQKLYFEHVQDIGLRGVGQNWDHESVEGFGELVHVELMPTIQYLFRYDRGGFWAASLLEDMVPWLGAVLQQPILRTMFHSVLATPTQMQISRLLTDQTRENMGLFQDLGVPLDDGGEAVTELLGWLDDVRPVWLCPLRTGDKTVGAKERVFATNDRDTDSLEMDGGLYGRPLQKMKEGKSMREIGGEMEIWMRKYDGHKGLYGFTFADEAEFNSWYNMDRYWTARRRYGAEDVFVDLFKKVKR